MLVTKDKKTLINEHQKVQMCCCGQPLNDVGQVRS